MIDAKGIAALDRRIRFGNILLLFFASTAAALVVYWGCAIFGAPKIARALAAIAAADLSGIWGYQLLADNRDWLSLIDRFSAVPSRVLWASAAAAIASPLVFTALVKVLLWLGFNLPSLPSPDFLTGGWPWLPATLLCVGIIGPAAEELMTRGLLLDWLRQKMPVWPAILTSALVFGLLHGIALQGGPSGWLQLGYRVGFGILTAWLAVRYQSLRPSFVFHATNNCFIVIAACFET